MREYPPLSNTKIEIVYQSHADIWKKHGDRIL